MEVSSLNRLRQIAQVFVRHGFSAFVDQLGLADRQLSSPRPASVVAARFGRRLALALADLGPTYVKLGQILATRSDALPASITQELAQLQDRAKPFPTAEARRQVERELNGSLTDLFGRFDSQPLAAASIGQVHRATLPDGVEVVIKIRRPGIQQRLLVDLDLLARLAELIEARIPESRRYRPRALVAEFDRGLRRELSFLHEARTTERAGRLLHGVAVVPVVYRRYSTDAVLTLQYLDGVPLGKIRDPEPREQIAQDLLRCFVRQYLTVGLFHADPHPGNLLVTQQQRLALLDFGTVGQVDNGMRKTLFRLAAAVAARDPHRLARATLAVSSTRPSNPTAFAADVGALLEKILAQPLRQISAASIVGELFAAAQRHDLHLKTEYFHFFRSLLTLDGVLRQVAPELDVAAGIRSPVITAMLRSGSFGSTGRILWSMVARRWRAQPRWWRRTIVLIAFVTLGSAIATTVHLHRRPGNLLPSPSGSATGTTAAPRQVVISCWIRAQPNRRAPQTGAVSKGSWIAVTQRHGDFWQLSAPRQGYVHRTCLAEPHTSDQRSPPEANPINESKK